MDLLSPPSTSDLLERDRITNKSTARAASTWVIWFRELYQGVVDLIAAQTAQTAALTAHINTTSPVHGIHLKRGVGSPVGTVAGTAGDLYVNISGGAGATLWVKESDPTTTTGWIAK